MKNHYKTQPNYWYPTALIWITSLYFSYASLAQAPVIQWQRVIEPRTPGAVSGRSFIVQNSAGGYSVVTADRRLISLSTAGEVLSDVAINGVSSSGASSEATSTVSPIATADNGIVVAVLDNQRWALQKRTITGELIWNTGLNLPVSSRYTYSISAITAIYDGGFLTCGTFNNLAVANPLAPSATYVIVSKFSSTGTFVWQRSLQYTSFDAGTGGQTLNSTRVEKAISSPNGRGFLLVGWANPTSSNSTLRGWAAGLGSDGIAIWQKRYEQMNTLNDVSAVTTGMNVESHLLNGYALSSTPGLYSSSTFRIDTQGNELTTPVQVPSPAYNSLASVAALPSQARPAVYVVGNDTPQDSNGGDIRLTSFSEQGSVVWTKTLGGSGRDYAYIPSILPTPDGILVAGMTESNNGDVSGRQQATAANWIVKLVNPANALTLSQPTYNCSTGAITFNTTGGDGTPITYSAPGITRLSVTSNTGVVEQELRNDPKPITITAMQSGRTISYLFDLKATCSTTIPGLPSPIAATVDNQVVRLNQSLTYPAIEISSNKYNPAISDDYKAWAISAQGLPPGLSLSTSVLMKTYFLVSILGTATQVGVYPVTVKAINTRAPQNPPFITTFTITVVADSASNALVLLAPTYNCPTGAITFNTAGGDGYPIEFQAIGITGWTTNPNQFVDKESRTVNDVKPFTLSARQNGYVTTYVWDLKAACGRARVGFEESNSKLSLTVLGNPVSEQLRVRIGGAEGQLVHLQLTDQTGHVLESRIIHGADQSEEQLFRLTKQNAGLLLLRAVSNNQVNIVKIIKQ